MLFNSLIFIFCFLPVTLSGFFIIGNYGHHRIAKAWLVGASLFFYGWWNPAFLGLIIASIIFNYAIGIALLSNENIKIEKLSILIFGVSVNLSSIAYFKYADFFIEILSDLSGKYLTSQNIILPLAISFFTFQQITYLVDAYKGEAKEYDFLSYCLFVTFFPQLIAGPIVHHKEMLPQFSNNSIYRFSYRNLTIGTTLFVFGLFKKVIIADHIANYATPVFTAADSGTLVPLIEAWGGALAYTFQLYFDFSGYSDMAIGLAMLFGISLPINFNSPYKAVSIIDFWRRWHITLSRFLRDYIYFPLGGSRNGLINRNTNLLITMLLGGLWHGAGWTFVLWGGLHGIYLAVNHTWRNIFPHKQEGGNKTIHIAKRALSRFCTFILIVIAWVIFRAESIGGVKLMFSGMLGFNGFRLPIILKPFLKDYFDHSYFATDYLGLLQSAGFVWIAIISIIVFASPNSLQLLYKYKPALEYKTLDYNANWIYKHLFWKPNYSWCFIMTLLSLLSFLGILVNDSSEFLYFNF